MSYYLISTLGRAEFEHILAFMKIKKCDAVWVPLSFKDLDLRRKKLQGRSVTSECFLIGHFTEREKKWLIRPRPNCKTVID